MQSFLKNFCIEPCSYYNCRTITFSFIYGISNNHCMQNVHLRSFSGPYFPVFRLNTERCSISLRILSKCWKMWTRITPNMNCPRKNCREMSWKCIIQMEDNKKPTSLQKLMRVKWTHDLNWNFMKRSEAVRQMCQYLVNI